MGGGIAGLACAHRLRGRARVTLYERADRLGGHVHAVTVPTATGPVAVETGFLAFHRSHYPTLSGLLDAFGIATAPSGVGLGIWDEPGGLVFDRRDWFTMFGHPGAAAHAGDRLPAAGRAHLADLVARLWRHARRPEGQVIPNVRLDEFLAERGYDAAIARYVLGPSIAALWGFQPAEIMAMSARTVADSLNRFFHAEDGEPFERIVPSTDAWLARLVGALDAQIRTGLAVSAVRPAEVGVVVETAAGTATYDAAVLALHADDALRALAAPTARQREVLGAFTYNATTSIVHTDAAALPPDPAAWSDYNYRARQGEGGIETLATWDMRRIQGIEAAEPVLVTVGPRGFSDPIDPARVLARVDYRHPASPPAAVAARPALAELNAGGPIYLCGSYFGSTGSNECAIASALRAADAAVAPAPSGSYSK